MDMNLAVDTVKYYNYYNTPIGVVTISSDGKSVTSLKMGKQGDFQGERKRDAVLDEAYTQLCQYLKGERETFDLPLNPDGSDYQKKVWQLLMDVPYSKTVTYKDLALAMGKKKSFRAVGGAVSRNPILIFIPCHRVVGLDGSLTGYSGGIDVKEKLLNIESK